MKTIILDLNSSPYVVIAEARSEVRDILRSENLEELLGHISRSVSVNDLAVEVTRKNSIKSNFLI